MRPPSTHRPLNFISLLLVLSLVRAPVAGNALIPVTGDKDGGPAVQAVGLPDLITFSDQVSTGPAGQIAGLYVEGLFALPIVQQPAGQPVFVSTAAEVLTQFGSATAFGSLGLLAHDNLSGSLFVRLVYGEQIVVVYRNDHYAVYRVAEIRRFQAVEPTNPYSTFVDLTTNQVFTAEQVFYQTYGVAGNLVLQTCISAYGNDSWGRLFVIAEPVPPEPPGKQSN